MAVTGAAAQTPSGHDSALTAATVGRYLTTLAADSFRGPTPSPALERRAQYVAAEFRALGLTPGLPDWNWNYTAGVQPFPLPGQRRVDYAKAGLKFVLTLHRDSASADAPPIVLEQGYAPWHALPLFTFARDARYLIPVMPAPFSRLASQYRSAVLLAGPQTVASAQAAPTTGHVAFYLPDAQADSATVQAIVQVLLGRSVGVVLLSRASAAAFAAEVAAGAAAPAVFADEYQPLAEDRPWAGAVRAETLRKTLALNGVDLEMALTVRTPLVQPLPFLLTRLNREAPPEDPADSGRGATAPNAIATLPGRDTAVQHQCIVVTAVLDPASGASGALNAADLLALARAFGASRTRPRRTILFLATSGAGVGFAGTQAFVAQVQDQQGLPRAVVTLDLGWPTSADLLAVDGLQELAFKPAVSPRVLMALHPDFRIGLVDTGSVLQPNTEPGTFSGVWMPTVRFRGAGRRAAPADTSAVVTAHAHALRLVFAVVEALANAETADLPVWTADAKRVLLARPTP